MNDDDGSGMTGTIINNAWKQEFYNQIDAYVGGTWIPIAHSAAMYTASAGTWTVTAGNQGLFRYAVIGKTAFFMLQVSATTTSASTVRLFVTLPAGIPPSVAVGSAPATYFTGAAGGTGYVEMDGTLKLGLLRDIGGTPWPAVTNSLYVYAQWFYPIA